MSTTNEATPLFPAQESKFRKYLRLFRENVDPRKDYEYLKKAWNMPKKPWIDITCLLSTIIAKLFVIGIMAHATITSGSIVGIFANLTVGILLYGFAAYFSYFIRASFDGMHSRTNDIELGEIEPQHTETHDNYDRRDYGATHDNNMGGGYGHSREFFSNIQETSFPSTAETDDTYRFQ